MKYPVHSLLLLLLFPACMPGYAQDRMPDSLLAVLKTTKEDTNKVLVLNNIARHLYSRDSPTALGYYLDAGKLTQQLRFPRELAVALNGQGWIKAGQSKHDEAMMLFKRSLAIRESMSDHVGIGHSYNNIGSVYEFRSEYDSPIFFYDKAIIC
jgi:tetratricopeptide (TPR) repeat protein